MSFRYLCGRTSRCDPTRYCQLNCISSLNYNLNNIMVKKYFSILLNFSVDIYFKLCYYILVARRGIEAVITRRSWKPFGASHKGSNPFLSAIFLFIFYILYNVSIWSSTQVVTGNTYERVRWTIQRVFVGAAVDKRDTAVSSHRAPQEGTKPRNL